jgi:hypothetical protein
MIKEKLEERLQLLEQEREQIKVTLAAYDGAIQECKHWLSHSEEIKQDG